MVLKSKSKFFAILFISSTLITAAASAEPTVSLERTDAVKEYCESEVVRELHLEADMYDGNDRVAETIEIMYPIDG